MEVTGKVIQGKYYDSVSLMRVSKRINEEEGIEDSSIVMGTHENKAILKAAGLFLDEFENTSDNELLVAVKGKRAREIIEKLDDFLAILKVEDKQDSQIKPKSISKAKEMLPGANLALISIAGKYAAGEAKKALKLGMNVMLFSDNVSLEDEISLKEEAQAKDLIVMGPDCGTAIINGTPLAFANVVNRGDIGIVAASGTGLQEVSTLISNGGKGISQAIGTGGRDVKKDVGGISFLQGIKMLAQDDNTKTIVLVSKPPHEEVMKKIIEEVKKTNKKTIAVFLGGNEKLLQENGIMPATTLEDAANLALGWNKNNFKHLDLLVKNIKRELKPEQKYIRALYSGGTFTAETQIIWSEMLGEFYSNVP
ncbi:MAG: FdrA family protein, partial [Bacteriovoracia bacterium]